MEQKQETTKNIQDAIMKEYGFDDLSDEKQKQLIVMMTDSVIKQVLLDAYTKLSDSDRKEFEEIMENIEESDPSLVETFLREKLTDYDELVQNAIDDLKKDIDEMKY